VTMKSPCGSSGASRRRRPSNRCWFASDFPTEVLLFFPAPWMIVGDSGAGLVGLSGAFAGEGRLWSCALVPVVSRECSGRGDLRWVTCLCLVFSVRSPAGRGSRLWECRQPRGALRPFGESGGLSKSCGQPAERFVLA